MPIGFFAFASLDKRKNEKVPVNRSNWLIRQMVKEERGMQTEKT
jgi:hypothetical protein